MNNELSITTAMICINRRTDGKYSWVFRTSGPFASDCNTKLSKHKLPTYELALADVAAWGLSYTKQTNKGYTIMLPENENEGDAEEILDPEATEALKHDEGGPPGPEDPLITTAGELLKSPKDPDDAYVIIEKGTRQFLMYRDKIPRVVCSAALSDAYQLKGLEKAKDFFAFAKLTAKTHALMKWEEAKSLEKAHSGKNTVV